MSSELVRAVISGRWAGESAPDDFPGRALQAWLYGELAARDEELTTALHDASTEKPFQIALTRGHESQLVIGAYGPLSGPVRDIVATLRGRLLLNGRWWELAGAPEVECVTWEDLASRLLAPAPAPISRFHFVTPTTFRTGSHNLPLPVPSLVFGSLLERWRRWSPLDLGPEASNVLGDIVLRRHRLQSVAVQLRGHVPAFVGTAEFELREPHGHYVGLMETLTQFASFAGVGARVSAGFGLVETELVSRLQDRASIAR